MEVTVRVRVLFVVLVLGLALPAAAFAGRPVHSALTFNSPADDVAESAFATTLCGFPVTADIGGRIGFIEFDRGGAPGVFELAIYGLRVTYRNPDNGNVVRLRDIGPDRFYVQDGIAFVAVTGRSLTGTGNIGVFKINLETGEVVHAAGNEVGFIFDHLCDDLS